MFGRKRVILTVLICAELFFVATSWSRITASGLLKVVFFDVGQGDAVFIETPSGKQVLIDGGPDRSVLQGLGKEMPILDRSIDVIVATHPDSDHISGLPEVLNRYDVETVIDNGQVSETATFAAYNLMRKEEGVSYIVARRGQMLDFGDGVTLTILAPDKQTFDSDKNDDSIVARLDYGSTSFLFTGDAPVRIEQELITSDPEEENIDVLKVGHHGSDTSSDFTFLQIASPQYAVISAGLHNRYGHPHQEVLNNLAAVNTQVLKTYEMGNIVMYSDGHGIEVGK